VFFDLNSPGGEIDGQNWFETDVESQGRVEVGLELGFELGLGEGLVWCGGGKDGIQVLEFNFPVYKNLVTRVRYTPPPIPVGFRFVRPDFPESQESGGLFFCMYCPFIEVIRQDSFIKFTPGIPGFPPDKFTTGLTGINWTNRTARGLPNKSLAHNKNRTRALRYNIPTQRNTLNH
jgi:hypothetical protein